MGSWNTLNGLSNRLCVPDKTEDLNLDVFNSKIRVNESKTLTKHIPCKCKCKFGCSKCNSNQKWYSDKCKCECKNCQGAKKIMAGIQLHVFVRMVSIQEVLLTIQ